MSIMNLRCWDGVRLMPEPFDINAIGTELFGRGWHGPVADLLEINLRTVQRWASGKNDVPEHAQAVLIAVRELVRAYRDGAPT